MAKTQISNEAVRRVATLAALALSPAEEARMKTELDSILGHMAELDGLDCSAVEPLFYAVPNPAQLRRDAVIPSLPRLEILAAAPEDEAGGFAVPKVLDVEG